MNYLAHQYLSGCNKEIRIGNFLGDFMKGKELTDFPRTIQVGITLHRIIDEFTDTHPLVARSKKLLHPRQGKYSSVLLDVYYDYFLAKNWTLYSHSPLEEFAKSVYDDFWELKTYFPKKVVEFLPHMRENDWFSNYKTYWGINKALQSIGRRANYSNTIQNALTDLQELEEELEKDFLIFFPELVARCEEYFKEQKLEFKS
jgi:acyl carrier protein phosphodiesterase